MNTRKIIGYGLLTVIITLAFVVLSLTGCETPTAPPKDKNLSGTITISPSTDVTTGTELTATYSGSEGVTYQWKKDGETIDGATSNTYTPSEAGSYTVTVSAAGYAPKSAAVTVSATVSPFVGITYSVEQTGGTDDIADSTGIVFTFSGSVDSLGLSADDITVGEAAAKGTDATLTGEGTSRTLSPITVSEAGQATVTITKSGIEAGTKHVTVYKAGESAPTLTGITAAYTGGSVAVGTDINSLKSNLTVTAQYDKGGDQTLSANEYTLSGDLTVGSSTVTVTYAGKTATFDVTVAASVTLTGITAAYTPTTAIYTDTTLDTLKEGLTVTAQYSDGTTKTVNAADYALSVSGGGALAAGENTVTVTYTEGGVTKTGTFTVTVNATHIHNWSKISETAATCTTAGTEVWECTAVTPSHHEDRPGAAALGHDSGAWHITTPATCTENGTRELRCTRDNFVLQTDTTTLTALGHNWGSYATITDPTCTTKGVKRAVCTRDGCEATNDQDIAINPDAHDWGGWVVTTPPTTTEEGEQTRTCKHNSAHIEKESVGKLPPVTVTIKAIPDVTPPATLAEPVRFIESDQYDGEVRWADSEGYAPSEFMAGEIYTATITLIAIDGWTLDGVAEDFFTVAGATSATNAAGSGVITAVFPAPQPLPLTGTVSVTANGSPVTGRVAVSTALTAVYNGPASALTYQWNKDGEPVAAGGDSETFTPTASGTYTVTAESGDPNYGGSGISGGPVIVVDFIVRNAGEWTNARTAITGNSAARAYIIYFDSIYASVDGSGSTFNTFGNAAHTVTLTGNGRLTLDNNAYLIQIRAGQTLIIDGDVNEDGVDRLELRGRALTDYPLINVSGANTKLELKHGKITGHANRSGNSGGGVAVVSGAFIMSGGEISDNTTTQYGGGVFISGSTASFTMNGGTISGNTSNWGGGVALSNSSSFTMNGGTISGNTNTSTSSYGQGGGVYLNGGSFTMNGGTISNNRNLGNATSRGGGVYMVSNVLSDSQYESTFTMTGGTISGNTSTGYGGGVFFNNGTSGLGSFTKTGGIIYGNDAPDEADRNTSTRSTGTGNGHAVYWNGDSVLYRDATLGATDNLSTGDTDTGWGQ